MESNKIKLLILWDILCKYTDEEHAMNTDEIIAALKEKGISVIRKVVAEDIKTLNDYGYEVLSYKKRYHYYYVVNRPFDIAEIVMLTDVVKSSKLTDKRKKDITENCAERLEIIRLKIFANASFRFPTIKRAIRLFYIT